MHVLSLCTLFTFQLCPYLSKGNAGTIVKTRSCIQSTNSVLKKNQLLLQTTDNKTSFFPQRHGGLSKGDGGRRTNILLKQTEMWLFERKTNTST